MKYMGTYYNKLSEQKLRTLKSQKYNRLQRLERDAGGYFHAKEVAQLKAQIGWIEAVLASRAAQMSYLK